MINNREIAECAFLSSVTLWLWPLPFAARKVYSTVFFNSYSAFSILYLILSSITGSVKFFLSCILFYPTLLALLFYSVLFSIVSMIPCKIPVFENIFDNSSGTKSLVSTFKDFYVHYNYEIENRNDYILSYKEFFHTKACRFFEGQCHFDSNTEHFCQCSISESLQWLGFLLHIQKINRKRKQIIDLWVKRSKVNLPATLLYFWQNIFTPFNQRCIQLRKQM